MNAGSGKSMKWKTQRRRNASGSSFSFAGDDDDRPLLRDDLLAGLDDLEAHAVDLVQKIVRELEVGFVDLVDQTPAWPRT